ncbi:thiamine phosphate synthase [uncultured Polaribacter sp.]|uniref:thiamine phosphate synthase n=1 Tax=uncultured Polaribacter sp. TaxID=174711 RepID=UPI002618703D|nr:thiamine phosphate synthase [uncultured Polaribacter sp.]
MIHKLHYISQGKDTEAHLQNIKQACVSGIACVQLRLKNVDFDTVLETAKKAREITAFYQTRLIINDFYKIAKLVNADGVHLGKNDFCPLKAREYLGKWYTIGGTANTLNDCEKLVAKNVDYIGLGPFQFTKTKKELSPVLGFEGYQKIIGALQATTPILAIGGVTLQNATKFKNLGLYGLAVSSEITNDFNKISTFHKILEDESTREQVYDLNKK